MSEQNQPNENDTVTDAHVEVSGAVLGATVREALNGVTDAVHNLHQDGLVKKDLLDPESQTGARWETLEKSANKFIERLGENLDVDTSSGLRRKALFLTSSLYAFAADMATHAAGLHSADPPNPPTQEPAFRTSGEAQGLGNWGED